MGFEDALHQTGEAMPCKLGLNHADDPFEALLFQIDQIVGQFLIVEISEIRLGFSEQALLTRIIAVTM